MLDPTLMMFENHWEAIIFFAGCFVFVFVCCLIQYRGEEDIEKRKDTLVQWVVLDGLFAVGIAVDAFYEVISDMM